LACEHATIPQTQEHGTPSDRDYFYRHEDKPFHIDYVFVPKSWRVKSVEAGSFQEWGHLSDHVPVVVDVTIGGNK
jgi:endonuclease/exonuclease/phosphatase family metal-dependent hydrolase